MIVNVIPEIKTWSDVEIFSYSVPTDLTNKIKVGVLVEIPLGRKKIRGVVESLKTDNAKTAYKMKNIVSVINDFVLPQSYLEVVRWISKYYLCSLGDALSLFLPPAVKKPKAVPSAQYSVLSKRQLTLAPEQQKILSQLKIKLTVKNKKPALIHGVTGSGKTEIYIKLTEEALKLGKSVIILVPEIMLTPQTVERFEEIFGNKITLRHSKLSRSEKYHTFYDFYTGAKPILIGPRSALLIPSENLGLIIVDEEQEDSYKQDQAPRYHAVELAKYITEKTSSLLVLGSATPRIKTYYQAQNSTVDLYELNLRHNKDKLPHAEIVDLKDEIRAENFSPISRKLKEEMNKVLLNKDQVLLFLNRRGNATFVACRDCGHVILCHNCSIPMVYHLNQTEHFLNCHHCDRREAVPTHCPECHSQRIKYFGSGIDKIETEIHNLYPDKRISKVDSKTIRTKSDYTKFFQRFKKGEIDIVIGTQMIAKGLDIPNVDLVGIISADTGLHLPHYRASEKSFELLTQVSGRSGRADKIGQTIIQTYWPESTPVVAAKDHDYKSFYQNEISERQKFNYPPFCYLVRVIAEDADEDKAKKEIKKMSEKLKENNLEFIGPGVCFYSKLHNKYRYHLIIKTKSYPDKKIVELARTNRHLIWDTEPTNLL